ncbi:hypothetical protein [Meiothermus taiwanensis]|uniref:hypothetical protein n=1 Tax=Meiothermus taiwanensis TaxID=172827 RepID=UPI001CBD39A8|nr:hypothetical protein [Meiothermus taiwanensis]
MNDIPKEWQLEPHYEPGLYWLSREPRPIKLFGKELPAKESVEYPGWYFLQRGEPMRIVDSLEEALAALKSRLKHWNMIDLLGRPAPIEASKSVRKQMVIDLLNAPIATPPPDYRPRPGRAVPPAFVQMGAGRLPIGRQHRLHPFPPGVQHPLRPAQQPHPQPGGPGLYP